MCGLFGTFRWKSIDVAARLELLAHRGPDGSGIAEQDGAVHGHVRLALVDLTDASAQPFRHLDGLLSFNGEIWNWREVRFELEGLGRTFRTSGDTEVLAQALDEWGIAALPRLEGMFAFAWSTSSGHWLVRDRYGKVPLYVTRRGDAFAWSSERKGFRDGEQAVALPPGTMLDLTTGSMARWYGLPEERPRDNRPLAQMLEAGVRARLAADAPVCCLISGGLDSSLILSMARSAAQEGREVVAYTARLADGSHDLKAARRLCDLYGIRLVEVPVRSPEPRDLEAAVRAIEIPSKAQVEIAALCIPLAAAIASDGFKACLSGEAADELFGGYGNMCIAGSRADDAEWRAIRVAQLAKMARGNFIRCNKVFMAHGVECRLPFMERALVETVLAMSKADCPPGKKALKAAADGLVPDWIIRRPKDTFQGGAGMIDAAASVVPNPKAFYTATCRTLYGPRAGD
jgi:asparagine synthase (glutamine-hydrolysing)